MNKPVVLIAGGPTVIGSAAAVAFAKKDARVVAAGRRDEAGKALTVDTVWPSRCRGEQCGTEG